MSIGNLRSFALLGSIGLGCVSMARVEPGAFLNRPASTMTQLLAQVQSDPEVAARFIQHYRMTLQEILSYFRTLRLSRLPQAGDYLVYASHDDGIRSRVLRLPKGTAVWIEQDGDAALRTACANPMGTGPRLLEENPEAQIEAIKVPKKILRDPIVGESQTMQALAQEAEPGFTMPTEEPIVDVAPPTLSPPEPLPPLANSGGLGWLPLLLGPIFLGGDSGGDASVPEPATLAALALGAVPVLRAAKRRNRR